MLFASLPQAHLGHYLAARYLAAWALYSEALFWVCDPMMPAAANTAETYYLDYTASESQHSAECKMLDTQRFLIKLLVQGM